MGILRLTRRQNLTSTGGFRFRDRLAHWEPVFSRTAGFIRQLEDVDSLYFALSPAVGTWAGERSTVHDRILAVPEPVLSVPSRTYLGVHT